MRHLSRTAVALAVGSAISMGAQADVVISQYLEDGYNKAIQIKNTGSTLENLEGYELFQYSDANDRAKPISIAQLSGTLAANGTLVVGSGQSQVTIQEIKDAPVKGKTYFNGDDTVALFKDGQPFDVVGLIGQSPTKSKFEDTIFERKTTYTAADNDGFVEPDSNDWNVRPCQSKSNNCDATTLITQGYTEYQAPVVTIADVNGDLSTLVDKQYLTDYVGQEVKVKGLVTYYDSYKKNAFIQAADDSNVNTPDGIRLSGSLDAKVGDTIWVVGTVKVDESLKEYYHPLPFMEIKSVTVASGGDVIQSDNLASVVFKGDEMPNQYYDSDSATFDPQKDGNDFLRRYAGMKVTVQDPIAVTNVNKYGNVWVAADRGKHATGMKGPRGGMIVSPINGTEATATEWDYNPEVIKVIEKYRSSRPTFQAGTELTTITGFLGWDYGEYSLFSDHYMTPDASGEKVWPREVTDLTGDENHLTVSNFNVENLVVTDDQAKFDGLAKLIVTNLKSPDIIALQEVGDDSGVTKNDGVVDSDKTLQKLVDAIKVVDDSISYGYSYISPQESVDGGKPGLNIRVAYLYNTDRVGFIESASKAGPTDNGVVAANGELSFNPVRVNTDYTYDDKGVTKQAFDATRKTLAAQFVFNGHRITLLNNHWSSKRGEMPVNGKAAYQMNPKRNAQAKAVREFIDQLLAQNSNAKVVALGDMNEFYYNEPLKKHLSGASNGKEDMHNLTHNLPLAERFSYVFGGNTQELDHLFVSNSLLDGADAKPVHVNAEYPDQMSDHDPMVAKLMVKKSEKYSTTQMEGKNEVLIALPATAVVGDVVKVTLGQVEAKAKIAGKSADVTPKTFEQTLTDIDIKAKAVNLVFPSDVVKGEYELSAQLFDASNQLKSQLVDKAVLEVTTTPTQPTTAPASSNSSGGSFGFGALLALAGLGWTRRRRT